jgi:hypothetical protein
MNIQSIAKLLASLSFFACTSLFAAPLVVDVTGVQSFGVQGDPGNTVLSYNVGANAAITSITYNVNLTAYDPSWLSEIGLFFSGSDLGGVEFVPGFSMDEPGTATFVAYFDLIASGDAFAVREDGILRLEFFEAFNDSAVTPDGQWNFGTITFGINETPVSDVPEPGTTALFGAGLMLMAYAARRRRRAH